MRISSKREFIWSDRQNRYILLKDLSIIWTGPIVLCKGASQAQTDLGNSQKAFYDQMTAEAARRLIDIWQEAAPAVAKKPGHAVQWENAAGRGRQAAAEIPRRTASGKEPNTSHHRANGRNKIPSGHNTI